MQQFYHTNCFFMQHMNRMRSFTSTAADQIDGFAELRPESQAEVTALFNAGKNAPPPEKKPRKKKEAKADEPAAEAGAEPSAEAADGSAAAVPAAPAPKKRKSAAAEGAWVY